MPLYNGDLEAKEGPPEQARAFKALLGEYQGVFIASPEYNSSITPLLKNTLDWVTRVRAKGETGLEVFKIARVRHLRRLARLLRGDAEPAASPPDPRGRHRRDRDPAADRACRARWTRSRPTAVSRTRRSRNSATSVVEALAVAAQEICRAMTLPRDRLIVALDVPSVEEAKALIETLGDSVGVYKIGLELLFSRRLRAGAGAGAPRRPPVFVDAKLLDIEATVERATAAIARMRRRVPHRACARQQDARRRGARAGRQRAQAARRHGAHQSRAADLIEQGIDHPLPSWCCIGPSSPRRPASTASSPRAMRRRRSARRRDPISSSSRRGSGRKGADTQDQARAVTPAKRDRSRRRLSRGGPADHPRSRPARRGRGHRRGDRRGASRLARRGAPRSGARASSASPSISTCFMRDLPPCATDTRRRRHFQPARDQLLQRLVGAAAFGQRAHARLQHRLAAERLDADDLVAAGFRREPHRQHDSGSDAAKLELERSPRSKTWLRAARRPAGSSRAAPRRG